MATYYQDPFGAPDYSAGDMPSLLSLSNLESLTRGSVAGLLGLPGEVQRLLLDKKYQPNLPSTEQLLATTPRMTAPTPQAGLLEDIGGFMSPVPAAVVKPAVKVAGKAGKAVARMAGEEINAAMMGERGGMLGAVTPQPMYIVNLPSKKVLGYDPAKLTERYPKIAPGVPTIDPKTGKEYIAKQLSSEAEAVQKARNAIQKDIEKGNYEPFFDVSKRAYVNPKNYPLEGRTLTDIVPAKQQTIDKYLAIYDTPQARENLLAAYQKAVGDPLAHNWYAMKQYEDEFIKQFGKEKGRQLFKERFADAMAATTGGADPKANFLMGQYGNFLREQGIAQPTSAVDFPFPIGGRFASGNMALYDKLINQGLGLTVQNPKRHNFSANFLGYLDRPTIDEQMSQLYQGGLLAPYPNTYGLAESVLNDVAASKGIMPVNLQDVAWIGAKGTTGKPMIQNINEAIERTSRITGLEPDEVVKKMLVGEIPTY